MWHRLKGSYITILFTSISPLDYRVKWKERWARGPAQKEVNEKLTTAERDGMFPLDPLDT
jgi:hypothetical protein